MYTACATSHLFRLQFVLEIYIAPHSEPLELIPQRRALKSLCLGRAEGLTRARRLKVGIVAVGREGKGGETAAILSAR